MQILMDTISANRAGQARGIYAICSANAFVLEAAIEQAKADKTTVLIEATANQINQFGGYTGMKPADFFNYVTELAQKMDFPIDRIILGGDHLGPVCWTSEPADAAMEKAHILIRQFVEAGFKKIHLDCSMPCADDTLPLADEIIADRAASLCETAERTAKDRFGQSDLVYVVGTEVPPPGGTHEEETELEVTGASHALNTVELHKNAFSKLGLTDVWKRVIGLVVQPGVEFSHTSVIQYIPEKATALKELISQVDNLVFEAHSTDYQNPENFKALVQDHFAILKVGPQLTFALREALYALSHIEDHLIAEDDRSNLRQVCEECMMAEPSYWKKFYQDAPLNEQYFYRHFSYSDRIRYYWPKSSIQEAIKKLFKNLDGCGIPLPLVSQYLPKQYNGALNGIISLNCAELVKAKIKEVTADYAAACWKQN